MDLPSLLASPTITTRPPADESAIAHAERDLGCTLPPDYRALLLESNGLEGFLSPESAYLVLHTIEFVASHQHEPNLVPDLIVIGSDGGGEAFGFVPETRGQMMYVRVPFLGDGVASMNRLAATLEGFIRCVRANDFA